MSSHEPRERLFSLATIAAGLMAVLLAIFKDPLTHSPWDFGFAQSLGLAGGVLLLLEGVLRRALGSGQGIWATLRGDAPHGTTVAVAIATIFGLTLLYNFRGYLVDDSFITFRFARHLAAGEGVVWNPGEPPVEGYSNFLWMIVLAAALKLGLAPLAVARVLGAGCHGLSAWLVYRLAARLSGSAVAARIALLVYAAVPAFVLWAMSGLETASVVLLALLYLDAFSIEIEREVLPWRAALWADLLVLSRPEAPLFLALSALPLLVSGTRRQRAWLARLVLLAAPVALLYCGWKWRTFGTLIPNTASAKARPLAGVFLSIDLVAFAFPLFLWWCWRRARGAMLPTEQQIMFIAVGFVLVGVNVAPQVGHDYRFFLPVLAPMLALAGAYFVELSAPGAGGVREAWRAVLLAVILANLFLPIFSIKVYADREMDGLLNAHFPIGAALRRSYRPTDVLAASDCGIIPYLSDMKTVDLWGLTDRRIATRGFSAAYVMDQHPDAVVLHSLDPVGFRGREVYDRLMYQAVEADRSYRLAGRWQFYGYSLWLFTRRGSG